MGWKGSLEHPRAELKYGVLPEGASSLIPVSWARLLALLSQLWLLPHPYGGATVSAYCEVGESLQRVPNQLPQEQGCSRALPLLTVCQQWFSGGFCSIVWVRGLKCCVWFHCCVPGTGAELWGSQCTLFGVCWSQCSVPPPCALCFQAASAWPQQQRNFVRLRGCEPGLGLPPDPIFLLLACCGQNQPLRARVGLLPWGCHQGWVTRRAPRGKEGALPAFPGGCWTLVWANLWLGHLGQPLSQG